MTQCQVKKKYKISHLLLKTPPSYLILFCLKEETGLTVSPEGQQSCIPLEQQEQQIPQLRTNIGMSESHVISVVVVEVQLHA